MEPGGEVRCSLLTPHGVGAIAVLRLTGAHAWDLARRVVAPHQSLPAVPEPDRVHFVSITDQQGLVDDVLLAARPDTQCPNVCVDLCCHGGRRVIERLLICLTDRGAIMQAAEPVSPSWQASVVRGIDAALAQAQTQRAALFLLAQRARLVAAFEEVLARIDRGEDSEARSELQALLATAPGAHWLIQPAQIALVGATNVGKSSLLNRLGGRDGAIVVDRSGTTRDWVTIDTAFHGVPVTLIDTAGQRRSTDALEREAMTMGVSRAASADVLVWVVDASRPETAQRGTLDLPRAVNLVVINKMDLVGGEAARRALGPLGERALGVSARTGAGMDALQEAVLRELGVVSDAGTDAQPTVFDRSLRTRLSRLLRTAEHGPVLDRADFVEALIGKSG